MIDRVVIATDGSPAAQVAVEAGLEFALAAQADVTFVHVAGRVADRLYREDARTPPTDETIETADVVLKDAATRAKAFGVTATVEVFAAIDPHGIADAILGVAAAKNAGIIVVGSRGRGLVAGALLGSVSQHVLRDAEVPVLVIPPGVRRARPSVAGS